MENKRPKPIIDLNTVLEVSSFIPTDRKSSVDPGKLPKKYLAEQKQEPTLSEEEAREIELELARERAIQGIMAEGTIFRSRRIRS